MRNPFDLWPNIAGRKTHKNRGYPALPSVREIDDMLIVVDLLSVAAFMWVGYTLADAAQIQPLSIAEVDITGPQSCNCREFNER